MLSDVHQKQVVRSSLIHAHPRSDIPFMHHCKRSWGSFSPPTPLSNASLLSRIAHYSHFSWRVHAPLWLMMEGASASLLM